MIAGSEEACGVSTELPRMLAPRNSVDRAAALNEQPTALTRKISEASLN
jgi:hypothetical protein